MLRMLTVRLNAAVMVSVRDTAQGSWKWVQSNLSKVHVLGH